MCPSRRPARQQAGRPGKHPAFLGLRVDLSALPERLVGVEESNLLATLAQLATGIEPVQPPRTASPLIRARPANAVPGFKRRGGRETN